MTRTTAEIPYEMIDGIGMFTIFNILDHAQALAIGLTEQNARDGITGCDFEVFERVDGKFLVTCIDHDDAVCWHVPDSLLAKAAA